MEKMCFVLQLPSATKEKFLAIDTFNGVLMNFIEDTSVNTELSVDIEADSREWNGKWYTSVMATNAEKASGFSSAKQSDIAFEDDDNPLPF